MKHVVVFLTHEFDFAHLIHTKAEFSHAMVVMDKTGGWHEEGSIDDDERYDGSLIG